MVGRWAATSIEKMTVSLVIMSVEKSVGCAVSCEQLILRTEGSDGNVVMRWTGRVGPQTKRAQLSQMA